MKLGPIMMDVSGFKLTEVEKTQLAKPSIGGVILFTRNYQNINQVKTLIGAIRKTIQRRLYTLTSHV
jgi:beta-N-acetylhexosaminidase